jgi:hypothetical protein
MPAPARIVDRPVEAPEARDGPVDQAGHLVLLAHVRADEFGFDAEGAQLPCEFLAGLLVSTGENEAVAFPVDARRGVATCIREEFSAFVRDQPSDPGDRANDRPGIGLQQGEYVSHPEAIPFESG